MKHFDVETFIEDCKRVMSESEDRQDALGNFLEQAIDECDRDQMISALDAAIPPGASIGEMIIHASPELTLLYGRVPPRFQSGIHNHTVFACIGQLKGAELNNVYERTSEGLRKTKTVKVVEGQVVRLPVDAIHSIENPHMETGSALHLYGGDFGAIMEQRSLWSVDLEERPFTFESLVVESVKTMKKDDNEDGLRELARAVPAIKPMVDSL